MRKKILVLILLLIVSCTNTNKGQDLDIEKNIYKGTQGVVLDFFDDRFPDEIFENELLSLAIRIENKGAYQVKNAKLLVSVEKEFMEFKQDDHIYEKTLSGNPFLEGKTYFSDFNDFHIEEITINVKELDDLSEYHDAFILTNFCYDFKGIAIADVCIDTDPHSIKVTDKVCSEISSISLSEGQGGPLIIERVETRMIVENNNIKPQFKLFFKNQGQGTVITPGKIDQICNKNSVGFDTYNTLKLTKLEFSNHNLGSFNCLPTELILYNNQDFMTCTYTGSDITKDLPAFLTPLKIEYEYGYSESNAKEIKIKKILNY